MKFQDLLDEAEKIPSDILKKFGKILFGELQGDKENDEEYEKRNKHNYCFKSER